MQILLNKKIVDDMKTIKEMKLSQRRKMSKNVNI
jgi:hypothetical protein